MQPQGMQTEARLTEHHSRSKPQSGKVFEQTFVYGINLLLLIGVKESVAKHSKEQPGLVQPLSPCSTPVTHLASPGPHALRPSDPPHCSLPHRPLTASSFSSPNLCPTLSASPTPPIPHTSCPPTSTPMPPPACITLGCPALWCQVPTNCFLPILCLYNLSVSAPDPYYWLGVPAPPAGMPTTSLHYHHHSNTIKSG